MADINATTHSTLSLSEYTRAVADLVAFCSGGIIFSEQATGDAANQLTSNESLAFSEQSTGELTNTVLSREALTFTELAAGAQPTLASSAEIVRFSETAQSANVAAKATESVAFSEVARLSQEIRAVVRESVAFAEKAACILVETDDGVWVVNLMTGGHSRYTGDLTGATPVDAYVLTSVTDFGSSKAKHVHEATHYMRADGDVELTTITDEQKPVSGYVTNSDGRSGMHRRRVKLAKGVKGTNWQFKIANVSGSSVTYKELEVPPFFSQRTA